jgi:hypothetical protein
MQKTFTPDYIRNNKGCYDLEQVNTLSFIGNAEIDIQTLLASEMPLEDKYWFVIHKCKLTTKQQQLLALSCAKITLHIYEQQYPNDARVADCITAAELCINNHTPENASRAARAADAAARAAARAARAAEAASAAARAAKAAARAAKAAAKAAEAASAAASAASRAADNKTTQLLLDNLVQFCKDN